MDVFSNLIDPEELRQAMEKFEEATRVDEKSEPAQQGARQAREELAQELAKQGEKQAQRKPDQPLQHRAGIINPSELPYLRFAFFPRLKARKQRSSVLSA